MSIKVIALSGKAGVGKSSIAKDLVRIIAEEHRIHVNRVNFGDMLKSGCAKYYGFPALWCYSQKNKLCAVDGIEGITVRQAMQKYGDMRREENVNCFVDDLLDDLHKMHSSVPAGEDIFVIVDDVRFRNELRLMKSLNAFTVRVTPYVGWKPGLGASHISETDLDNTPLDDFDLAVRPPYAHRFGPLTAAIDIFEAIEARADFFDASPKNVDAFSENVNASPKNVDALTENVDTLTEEED